MPYDVLDVRNSAWYEDVAAFRAGARDLEQMLANILGRWMEKGGWVAGQGRWRGRVRL